MGLIENMGKKGRAGVKLPVPTTAGDDQVIAAKTGEYVLPPEVVAAIGVEKLNALVQSITGQAPGGEPAEMPEGAMHEMMEGEMKGYAGGGAVGYAENTSPKLDILGGLKNAIIDPITEDFKQAYWTQRAARARYPGADAALNFVPYVGAATNLDDVAQDVRTKQYQDIPGDLAGAALNIGALKAYGAVAKSAPGAVKDAVSAVSGATGGKRGNMPAAASFTGSAVATPAAAYIDHYATKQKEADAKYGDAPLRSIATQLRGAPVGYANGGLISRMKGYASGGLISKWDGVDVDPFEKQSLGKYSFGADGSALDDSVSRQIDRSAKGMMQSDEVWDGARPQIEERMRRQPNGLISQLMGYAEGGIVEDDYTRRKLSNYNPQETIRQPMAGRPAPVDPNVLRSYNPQSTIPPNATTNASPRAPELRNYTPEPGRLQPGSTTPRISGLAATPPAGTPSATVRALDARVPGATSGGSLAGRVAGAALVPVGEAAGKFVVGADADVRNRFYNDPNVGWTEKAKQFGRDATGIALPSVGAAVGAGAGSVVAPVAGTVAGGAAGYSIGSGIDAGLQAALGESALDRYKATQPQQVAQAPQMTPKELSDEIARRRAALAPQPSFEQKIGKFIADERATPAPIAAAPQPKRGPVSGLAARAAKQSPAAPAAAAIDSAVMADAQAAQAQLDQSPIARVVGGAGGAMTIQYKDGTTKQVGQEGMDEVNGFYALTSRAAKQYDAQPVEIIAGNAGRSQAMPELGYQQVPDAIARSGKAGDYISGLAQGALDRADPVAAEMRTRLAEIAAQGDNSIRVSNATDRDGEGRGLRNAAARMELDLTKRALAGDPQAIQQLNLLRGKGGAQDEYVATTREVPVDPANPMLGTVKEPVIFNKRTGLPVQGGTVQSSSAAPQSAVAALRKDPKLAAQFDAKYGQGASAQYLNAR